MRVRGLRNGSAPPGQVVGEEQGVDYRIPELRRLAEEFRAAFVQAKANFPEYLRDRTKSFPKNSCDHASALLGRYLQEQGYSPVQYAFNGSRGPSGPNREIHAWLEIDNIILDITASQFTDQPEAVMATRDPSWHSTFGGVKREPVVSQLHFNQRLKQEYEKAYAEIKRYLSAG